jgi:hypothetical protein
MSYTRTQIRQRIGAVEFLNDTLLSTTSTNGAAAGANMIDTTLKQPDSFWNFGQVLIGSGTSSGDLRYVASWTQSTSTFVPDRAFTSLISSGVTYELHRLNTYTEKNAAINAAIFSAGKRWTQLVVDASITLDSTIYTYSLGSLATPMDPELMLDDIYYDTGASPTGYPYAKISPSFYTIRYSGDTPTLQFLDFPPINNKTLRLIYRVRPAQLATDAAVLEPVDDAFYNYVCAKSTAILFRARALNAPNAGYAERATQMDQLAESFFDLERKQVPGKPVINTELLWGETYRRNNWSWW